MVGAPAGRVAGPRRALWKKGSSFVGGRKEWWRAPTGVQRKRPSQIAGPPLHHEPPTGVKPGRPSQIGRVVFGAYIQAKASFVHCSGHRETTIMCPSRAPNWRQTGASFANRSTGLLSQHSGNSALRTSLWPSRDDIHADMSFVHRMTDPGTPSKRNMPQCIIRCQSTRFIRLFGRVPS